MGSNIFQVLRAERDRQIEGSVERSGREELIALNAISEVVSSSLDLDEILNSALDKVLEITGLEAGTIYLLDEKSQRLIYRVYRGVSQEFIQKTDNVKVGEGLPGRVAKTRKPFLVDNIPLDSSEDRIRALEDEGLLFSVGVPLRSKSGVMGVMIAASRSQHNFTSRDLRLLLSIGNQIGMAIENARLYSETQSAISRLSAAYRVSEALHAETDLKKLLGLIGQVIHSVAGGTSGHVCLIDDGREILEDCFVWNCSGKDGVVVQSTCQGKDILDYICRTGRTTLITTGEDPRLPPSTGVVHNHLYSIQNPGICIPLRMRGEAIGTISFRWMNPQPPTDDDLKVLEMLANHVAIAIKNAQLHEDLRKSQEKYKSLFEGASDAIIILDPSTGDIIDANHQAEVCYGYTKGELLKMNIAQLFWDMKPKDVKRYIRRVLRGGFESLADVKHIRSDRRTITIELNASAVEYGGRKVIQNIVRDITERRRIEKEKEIVNNINRIIASSPITEIFKEIGRELGKTFHFDLMSITLLNENRDAFDPFILVGDYEDGESAGRVRIPRQGSIVGKVVDGGKPLIIQLDNGSKWWDGRRLYAQGFRSIFSLPLRYKGRAIGALNFVARKPDNFSPEHTGLLEAISNPIAVAVQNMRLFNRVREVARYLWLEAGRSEVLSPDIQALIEEGSGRREASAARSRSLSDREIQVLKLIALGYTQKQIAGELNIALNTVESFRKRLGTKIGTRRKAELIKYAFEAGIVG
ncbi:MAG: GAF domain-containing protein [bacterium]